MQVAVDKDVRELIAEAALGDARRAYTILERGLVLARAKGMDKLDQATLEEAAQKKLVLYDKDADAHYDVISAFIKSMRGSDPDAALYYLAVMLIGGEDPKFIARRMVIFASEDIGNADPRALEVAVAVSRAVEFVGLPECRINLAHGVTYLACAPKSNASYAALEEAMSEVREHGALAPPVFLRSTGYKGAKSAWTRGRIRLPSRQRRLRHTALLASAAVAKAILQAYGRGGANPPSDDSSTRMRALRRGEHDQAGD